MEQERHQQRPKHNPRAREPEVVLGTALPDSVSAVTWVRPFEYVVVRTDDGRHTALDDYERGRAMSSGLYTRHNAIGRRANLQRRNPDATYEIVVKENDSYEGASK